MSFYIWNYFKQFPKSCIGKNIKFSEDLFSFLSDLEQTGRLGMDPKLGKSNVMHSATLGFQLSSESVIFHHIFTRKAHVYGLDTNSNSFHNFCKNLPSCHFWVEISTWKIISQKSKVNVPIGKLILAKISIFNQNTFSLN